MDSFIIRRRGAWESLMELELALARAAQARNGDMADRVRCIRSYVVDEPDGRLGSVCIYEAQDEQALREHARRASLPVDEITSVATSLIVHADPLEAAPSWRPLPRAASGVRP